MKTVAVLDNIRSLYNVGSMFRTSDALGIEKLYLCGITGTPEHSRIATYQQRDPDDRLNAPKLGVEKTALAAFDSVPWEHFSSTLEAIAHLKEQGFYILALEIHPQSTPFSSSSLEELITTHESTYGQPKGVALIVGNERDGITSDILTASHAVTHIPMHGNGASMNVAVSFAIAAWEITKRDR